MHGQSPLIRVPPPPSRMGTRYQSGVVSRLTSGCGCKLSVIPRDPSLPSSMLIQGGYWLMIISLSCSQSMMNYTYTLRLDPTSVPQILYRNIKLGKYTHTFHSAVVSTLSSQSRGSRFNSWAEWRWMGSLSLMHAPVHPPLNGYRVSVLVRFQSYPRIHNLSSKLIQGGYWLALTKPAHSK